MSFPRYEKYKESGVEWLGEVPEEWKNTKIKHIVQFQTGWTPPTGDSTSYEGVNLWANISDLGEKWLFDTAKKISDEAVKASRINISPKGSLLFSFKLSIGQVSFVGTDMYTNEAIATFLPNANICSGYIYYLFPFFITKNAAENIYGAKLLNQELIRSANIVIPPLPEQRTIAAFLDHETGKIDALVAEQEKLIGLLKEKRQAVISHAVTKGLDPNARMMDSGVEWLGEVPEGWEVKRLKSLVAEPLKYGANEAAEIDDPMLPRFVRITDIDDKGGLRDETFKSLPVEVAEPYLLKEGDVLLARSGATVGKSFIYSKHWGTACFAGYLIRARLDCSYCLAQWLYYFCQTNEYWGYIVGSQIQATIQNVSAEKYANLYLPIPSTKEQRTIAAFLDHETTQIDALIEEAKKAIELMKERRTAMISAAVTGKIDVRGYCPA